jgi:hypothetical protein
MHCMLLVLVLVLVLCMEHAVAQYDSSVTPFFGDPLFDGAHDAELVWHRGEQTW